MPRTQTRRHTTRGSQGARRTSTALPIRNYDDMTVGEIQSEIEDVSPGDIRKLQTYEEKHKGRQTLLRRFEQQRSRMGTRTGGASRRETSRRSATGGGSRRASSQSTTDHRTIQRWAEERGGIPVSVRGTGRSGQPGVLRFDFEGYGAGREDLREVSWDEFFKKFDQENLEFLYQDRVSSGQPSRFFKFVSRGSGARSGARGGGRTRTGRNSARRR